MNAQATTNTTVLVPSENWDDDFEFHQNADHDATSRSNKNINAIANPETRMSITSDDWDNPVSPTTDTQVFSSSSVLEDKKNYYPPAVGLSNWAEPQAGPSTPTKRAVPPPQENWDDDFEDSPARRSSRRNTPHKPSRIRHLESWDDDFEDPASRPSGSPTSKRTRRDAYPDSSDEDDGEFGFTNKEEEEDRTVTARSRRVAPVRGTPPPPVPALPSALIGMQPTTIAAEPFPGSPTVSVFSIPTTAGGRESVMYNSTTHLTLRPTISGSSRSFSALPPSPPIHRERRRLRKKSRPPHVEDHGIFELKDEEVDMAIAPSPTPQPSTPERSTSPPLPPTTLAPSSPGTKTPLLSRIGSVKKWGVRKKRASTGPSEMLSRERELENDMTTERTPRPASSLAQSPPSAASSASRGNWFFRNSAAGSGSPPSALKVELRHEKSGDRLRFLNRSGDGSPTKSTGIRKAASDLYATQQSVDHPSSSKTSLVLGGARRPISMQVPAKVPTPRHASYGGTSLGRTAVRPPGSASVEDLNREPPQEGSRSFMGSARKISLVGGQKRHKRTKSSMGESPPVLPPPLQEAEAAPDEIKTPVEQQQQYLSLLPPIELQPPSPPRVINGISTSHSAPISISANLDSLLLPSSPSDPATVPINQSPRANRSPAKAPGSPQSASLGRTVQVPSVSEKEKEKVPRRNSLGDLKIPARISQAQVGLRRDLGMVREFAASVEQLKELQATYQSLVSEVQAILDNAPPLSRAASPTFFNLPRPVSRARSNTNPAPPSQSYKLFASTYYTINARYQISWECAELLIELGGGTPTPTSPPSTSVSAPAVPGNTAVDRKSRERAITLAGDESKPQPNVIPGPPLASPPNLAWRASTGRHDLSQRQLVLLREMLNNPDLSIDEDLRIPEEGSMVNRQWRWGDAMSSTVTLPSEESTQGSSHSKKRRHSRMGMSGLRDMLRSLKKNNSEQPPPLPVPASSASASTDSSLGSHIQQAPAVAQRRRAKTSTGPESIKSTKNDSRPVNSPYNASSFTHKSSPRRPSLASIFRFSQKNKSSAANVDQSTESVGDTKAARSRSGRESTTTEEEDWDRIDSASDLDLAAKALGLGDGSSTVKGKKGRSPYLQEHHQHGGRPVTPKRTPNASQSSIWGDAPSQSPHSAQPSGRPTRLSNVEETVNDEQQRDSRSMSKGKHRSFISRASPSSCAPRALGGNKSGSVRSAPPPSISGADPRMFLDPGKLAMTPENIKPLLENAKEVHVRLHECIGEIRTLLAVRP